MGIPISSEPSLSNSVLFYLSYVRNKISIRDSRRVCCVFDLAGSRDSGKQRVQEIVQGEASKVHFVVQNATQETLIREYVPAKRIASLLHVELGSDLTKVLWDFLRNERAFMDVKLIAITLPSPRSRSIELNIKR